MTSTMESAPLLNRAASIAGQVHLSLVSSWGLGILVHNLALNRAGLISVIIEFIFKRLHARLIKISRVLAAAGGGG